jgi:purine nucleosidase
MVEKRKVIIDCDPGIDDSLALMLAISSEELEIAGITVVCGNVPANLGAENVLKILKIMNRLDIPVYMGEETPLVRDYISAQDTHGIDGLGETNYPLILESRILEDAPGFIIRSLSESNDLSIIALGPLTNIAKALECDMEIFGKLNRFVSMGGNFRSHGNCSPVAEYNYWCDPDAAKLVFETFADLDKKVEMVGLDVTRNIVLTPGLLAHIKRIDEEKGKFVESIVQFYFDFHWKYEKIIGCVINDPLAVAYFIDPSICNGFEAFTTVETEGMCIGQSVVDSMDFWKKHKNSLILTKVNTRVFFEMFIHRIFGGDKTQIKEILDEMEIVEQKGQ